MAGGVLPQEGGEEDENGDEKQGMEKGDETEAREGEEAKEGLVHFMRKGESGCFSVEDHPEDIFNAGKEKADGDPCGDHSNW